MSWKYPALLWLLLLPGALAGLYVRSAQRIPRRGAVRYPGALVAAAAPFARPVRRHLAAAAFVLAAAAAVLGMAGPVVPWPVASGRPVVLIIDISRSMEESDVRPSRIEAARTAALEFMDHLPHASRAALVTFGNFASVVVPLTDDRERMREGIRSLTTQLRTQLGNGLVEGIRAVLGEGGTLPATGPSPPSTAPPGPSPPFAAPFGAAPGALPPLDRPRAIAILLSDGRASDGIPPLEAAAEARRRGVRVYTVGVGTAADPSTLRSGYWGVLDEPTLRAIAAETGGEYFHASAAERLREVYRDLARRVGWERRPTEMSAAAGAVALALLVAAVVARTWLAPLA
ncbi:MAG: VWA domain-containing protein [Armatimonadota bacterium]|nr:VWA domain-containing protein [Armatimonadota bacterium]MDR7534977.1 VWA domain-containing protein [Armatimonadota bacterium]